MPYRSTELDGTPITGDRQARVGGLKLALVAFAIAFAIEAFAPASCSTHAVAAGCVLFGGMLAWAAWGVAHSACPRCSSALRFVRPARAVLCPQCQTFCIVGDRLRIAPPDIVDDARCFGARLPSSPIAFPDECCVCGEPATRTLAVRRDRGGVFDVPHCDRHTNGARVESPQGGSVVRFRSLRYALAFAALNDTALVGQDPPRRARAEPLDDAGARWMSLGIAVAFSAIAAGLYFAADARGMLAFGDARASHLVLALLYAVLGKPGVEIAFACGAALFAFAAVPRRRRS